MIVVIPLFVPSVRIVMGTRATTSWGITAAFSSTLVGASTLPGDGHVLRGAASKVVSALLVVSLFLIMENLRMRLS